MFNLMEQDTPETDAKIEYLAELLVDCFIDHKVMANPNFKDPRIGKDIRNLVKTSKERSKTTR